LPDRINSCNSEIVNRIYVASFVSCLSIACAKKTPPPEEPVVAAPQQKAPEPKQEVVPEQAARIIANFQRVHFEFDSSDLPASTRAALMENVELMRKYQPVKVEIQGHCDDRGTSEYNLALGDRRAQAIVDYMVRAGIEQSRLTRLSYGKEKPLQPGDSETVWAQNRRAEFRVTWKPQELADLHGTID
jgi:peptidoglycan-associated lipoprotein